MYCLFAFFSIFLAISIGNKQIKSVKVYIYTSNSNTLHEEKKKIKSFIPNVVYKILTSADSLL